ncbi:MAG: TonB-dependent receptor [Pseudohongiella sp.]|nr:TonB-dependent receptor [Pseudohongiella sp.]
MNSYINNKLIFAIALSSITAGSAIAQENITPIPVISETVLMYQPDFFASSNPATAQDMVSRIPGFSISNGDDVRGFAGAGGNVLINGARPASKSDSVTSVLGRTPAGRVAHIELIRGATPGIDMQGHSVVANVVLNEDVSRQHTVVAQGYFFDGGPTLPGGRYEYNATNNGRTTSLMLARVVAMNDSTGSGTLTRTDADGNLLLAERSTNKFEGDGWSGRASWSTPTRAGKLELTSGFTDYIYEEWLTYQSTSFARHYDVENDVSNADFAARLESQLSSQLSLETRLIHSLEQTRSVNLATLPTAEQLFVSDSDNNESILRSVLGWSVSDTLSVESSVELAYNALDTRQRLTINGGDIALPLSTTKVSELRAEMSSIATWTINDSLKIDAGARLERSTIKQTGGAGAERSFFYPKPRLAATWDIDETQQLRLRLERELGQLNFSDFAASSSLTDDQYFGGNLDLRPQQRLISEAVYEKRFSDRAVVGLTLRHDEISDVIDQIPLEDGLTATGNIGDGTLDRIALNVRLPLDSLGMQGARLTMSAQFDHTRVLDPTQNRERSISGNRPFRGRMGFEQDLQQLNMSWGINYNPYFRDTTYNPDQRRTRELRHNLQLFTEKTFSNGVVLRAEYTHWDDFRAYRDTWSDRSTQALAFREQQRLDPREFVQLRVRKTFG